MITEDYVSFEVAKLLKEKGFDGICQAYYDTHGFSMFNGKGDNYETRPSSILAPTIQMVMKWLRENHGIIILVSFFRKDRFSYDILLDGECGDNYILHSGYLFEHFKNYEDACEAAIKYTLENLVNNQSKEINHDYSN